MKLRPSLKQKKRYIVFEIQSTETFSVNDIQKEVDAALLLFLGQLGLAKSSPMFLKEKCKDNKFIVKVNHNWVDEAVSALILIKTIKKKPVLLRSVVVSGTIKKASSYLQ